MTTARLLEQSDVDGFVRDLPLIRPGENDDPDVWLATLRSGNRNPFGAIRFAIVEEDGQYLSMAATTPKPMVIGGESTLVAEIGSTFTRPEAQGKGHFTALVNLLVETAVDDGIQALYGTPNPTSARIYLNKLRWAPMFRATRWIRPLAGVAAQAVGLEARVVARAARGAEVCEYASVDELPKGVEDVAGAAQPHIDRSPEYTAWRYGHKYRVYALERGGRVLAWAAVNIGMRGTNKIVSIADLVVGPDAGGAAAWFLDEIARHESARGEVGLRFAYATTEPRPTKLTTAFLRAGFAPVPSPEPVIFQHGASTELLDAFESMSWRGIDADTA
jgi:GNAT superfamily N-acetyltransferase